jgi:CHAT domain-containing protein
MRKNLLIISLILYSQFVFGQEVSLENSKAFLNLKDLLSQRMGDIRSDELKNSSAVFIKETRALNDSQTLEWLNLYYSFAVNTYRAGFVELTTSLLNPLDSLDLFLKNDDQYFLMGRIFNIYGTALKKQTLSAQSVTILHKALDFFQKCEEIRIDIIPSMYNNIGNTYREMGEFSKAIEYLAEGERVITLSVKKDLLAEQERSGLLALLSKIKLNQGTANIGMGYYVQALEESNKGIELAMLDNPGDLRILYSNVGICYESINRPADAIHYYNLAISLCDPSVHLESFLNNSVNLLSVFRKQKMSTEFYDKAESIRKILAKDPSKPFNIKLLSTLLVQEALLNEDDLQLEKALMLLAKALVTLEPGLKGWEPDQRLPDGSINFYPSKSVEIINLLAKTKAEVAAERSKLQELNLAIEYLIHSEKIINQLRSNLSTQESKIILNQLQKDTYGTKAALCSQAFQFTGDQKYLDELFITCEQGKTAGLWSEIQQANIKSDKIPEELIDLERNIKNRIAQLQIQINDLADSEDQTDSINNIALKNERFALFATLDSISLAYNQTDSDYYKLKFDNQVLELTDLQKRLKTNEVFIQLYFSKAFLHQMFIKSDTIIYRAIENPETLIENCELLIDHLTKRRHNFKRNDVVEFYNLSYSLYNRLFSDSEHFLQDSDLIVSGDGTLNLIPFEVLISNDTLRLKDDFRDFRFLIYDHNITYSNTATLWDYTPPEKNRISNPNSIVSFAPLYSSDELNVYQDRNGQILPELPGTIEEVDFIDRKYRSLSFKETKATESNFKAQYHKAKILHLAMHTSINNDDPLQSYLVFSHENNLAEDGKISGAEILTYKFSAELAVLSACNTGSGKLREGEGIMGLARSFIQAGCQNLVINLWAMDDNFGKMIVQDFYQGCANGMTLSKALREAKIKHLKNSGMLEAHPHFWAGVIMQGKDKPVDIPKKRRTAPLLFIFLATGILVLVIRRKK